MFPNWIPTWLVPWLEAFGYLGLLTILLLVSAVIAAVVYLIRERMDTVRMILKAGLTILLWVLYPFYSPMEHFFQGVGALFEDPSEAVKEFWKAFWWVVFITAAVSVAIIMITNAAFDNWYLMQIAWYMKYYLIVTGVLFVPQAIFYLAWKMYHYTKPPYHTSPYIWRWIAIKLDLGRSLWGHFYE